MLKGLRLKFFLLLMAVVTIALAASFVIRHLMLRDFHQYEEGQLEDSVYWVMADLESSYAKNSAWNRDAVSKDAVWAMMMGFDIRLFDSRHVLIADTEQSLKALPALIQKKVLAVSRADMKKRPVRFFSYPLFLGGHDIGSLEAGFFPQPERGATFVRRSDMFRLFTVIALGGAAFALSILFSRILTDPLKRLAAAAEGIMEGDLRNRVRVAGHDEVARLSATFNRLTKFLEAQEALRKKLLGNVSHEIRTPLTAMRGELAAMIDGLITVDGAQLRSLYEETLRLESLLDGMEELSRAQAGAMFLHKKLWMVRPMFENIKNTFTGLCLEKKASLEIRCPDELHLYADPERLNQVVVNLVSNALKAVGKDGKVIMRAFKNGKETCIEVADNGCGIGKDALPFIFERFYKSSGGGIGIGLEIVKELVDAHEGRIEVFSSEEGKGTSFRVFIPARGEGL